MPHHRQAIRLVSTLLPALVLGLAGCVPNENGHVAAEGTGALLADPAPRLAAMPAPCGDGVVPDTSVLRLPYLQTTSATGVNVVWTAAGEPTDLVLTTVDGEPVKSVAPAAEETAYLEGGAQYVATVDGLEPGTTYCYSLLDVEGRTLFGPVDLRTAPSADSDERVDIIAFGDSGGAGPDQIALAEQLGTVPADLMVHTGDVAYLNGTLEQFEAGYFDVYAPLIARVPMFPTSGNHDYDTDGAGPFREVFVLPEAGGAEPETWYSFDWGPVHVVELDTERDGAEQAEWLRRDLARNALPWTIVVAHKGPHSSGTHGDSGAFQSLYEPLLQEHGVQLVLTGHDHHYERTVPIGGVTYVVTGGGGYSTRPTAPGELSAYAEGVTHFVYIAVEGDTMSVHAIDATGREFDGVELTL